LRATKPYQQLHSGKQFQFKQVTASVALKFGANSARTSAVYGRCPEVAASGAAKLLAIFTSADTPEVRKDLQANQKIQMALGGTQPCTPAESPPRFILSTKLD